jgi:hypothetical protein
VGLPARFIRPKVSVRKCSGRITILRPYEPSLSSDMAAAHILQHVYERAIASLHQSVVTDAVIRARIEHVCRCLNNRAGVRLLMACLLGKVDDPQVDPRK